MKKKLKIVMKKKNKRSYFKKIEYKEVKSRRNNLLKYVPKQPKLIKFLIDKDVDTAFIRGIEKTSSHTRTQAYRRNDSYDSICSSFTWAETKEGHDYWSKLSDEYNKWFRESK